MTENVLVKFCIGISRHKFVILSWKLEIYSNKFHGSQFCCAICMLWEKSFVPLPHHSKCFRCWKLVQPEAWRVLRLDGQQGFRPALPPGSVPSVPRPSRPAAWGGEAAAASRHCLSLHHREESSDMYFHWVEETSS